MKEALEADPQFQSRVYPAQDNITSTIRLHNFWLELRGGVILPLFQSHDLSFEGDGMIQPFHAHRPMMLMSNGFDVHERGDASVVALPSCFLSV